MLVRTYQRRLRGSQSDSEDGSLLSSQEESPWSEGDLHVLSQKSLQRERNSSKRSRSAPSSQTEEEEEEEGGAEGREGGLREVKQERMKPLVKPRARKQRQFTAEICSSLPPPHPSSQKTKLTSLPPSSGSKFRQSDTTEHSPTSQYRYQSPSTVAYGAGQDSFCNSRHLEPDSAGTLSGRLRMALSGHSGPSGRPAIGPPVAASAAAAAASAGPTAAAAAAAASLMEAQESGEMMERMDEASFALDGLRSNQPLAVQRSSAINIALLCLSSDCRRMLLANGMAAALVLAITSLPVDDNVMSFASAAALFLLASDRSEGSLLDSRRSVQFLVRLLQQQRRKLGSRSSRDSRGRKDGGGGTGSMGSKSNAAMSSSSRDRASRHGSHGVAVEAASKHRTVSHGSAVADADARKLLKGVMALLPGSEEDSRKRPASGRSDALDDDVCLGGHATCLVVLALVAKACDSSVSVEGEATAAAAADCRVQFKELWREQGGLQHVVDITGLCVEQLKEKLQSSSKAGMGQQQQRRRRWAAVRDEVQFLLHALRVVENVTFLNEANQMALLTPAASDGSSTAMGFADAILGAIGLLSASKHDRLVLHEHRVLECFRTNKVARLPLTEVTNGAATGGIQRSLQWEKRKIPSVLTGAAKAATVTDVAEKENLRETLEGRPGDRDGGRDKRLRVEGGEGEGGVRGVVPGEERRRGVADGRQRLEAQLAEAAEEKLGVDLGGMSWRTTSNVEPDYWLGDEEDDPYSFSEVSEGRREDRCEVRLGEDVCLGVAADASSGGEGGPAQEVEAIEEEEDGGPMHGGSGMVRLGDDVQEMDDVQDGLQFRRDAAEQQSHDSSGGKSWAAMGAAAAGGSLRLGEEADPYEFDVAEEGRMDGERHIWDPAAAAAESLSPHDVADDDVRTFVDDVRREGLEAAQEASSSFSSERALAQECLVSSCKVIMNLTNHNAAGCSAFGSKGGVQLIASLLPLGCQTLIFAALLKASEGKTAEGSVFKSWVADLPRGVSDTEEDLDLLLPVLGVLVNLVEKDSRNRDLLAALSYRFVERDEGYSIEMVDKSSSPPGLGSIDGVSRSLGKIFMPVPVLLCLLFRRMFKKDGDCGPGADLSFPEMCDEDFFAEGRKEAENKMVEVYSALLLAFLARTGEDTQKMISSLLPSQSLSVLSPILEDFMSFHEEMNTIPEDSKVLIKQLISHCS